jgi:hypothetical protein
MLLCPTFPAKKYWYSLLCDTAIFCARCVVADCVNFGIYEMLRTFFIKNGSFQWFAVVIKHLHKLSLFNFFNLRFSGVFFDNKLHHLTHRTFHVNDHEMKYSRRLYCNLRESEHMLRLPWPIKYIIYSPIHIKKRDLLSVFGSNIRIPLI